MSRTLLGYYSQALCNALASKYGDQLESLFKVEKLQLIGAIGLWAADCAGKPEDDWCLLGEHAAENGTIGEHFDAWDIVQNECNYADPQAAMPLLIALVNQVDADVYLGEEP